MLSTIKSLLNINTTDPIKFNSTVRIAHQSHLFNVHRIRNRIPIPRMYIQTRGSTA